MITTITEKKTFKFKRMPASHVAGYHLYQQEKESGDLVHLSFIQNPSEVTPVETLLENVTVSTDNYIEMPRDAYLDIKVIPHVIINDEVLDERDYNFSAYLKVIALAKHIKLKPEDKVDLIYHRDLVVHEECIEHTLGEIKLYDYFIRPSYVNSHTIGFHNIIE